MKQKTKVILSLHVANELIQQGFSVIEVKPSTKVKGNAAFVFESTSEFNQELAKISRQRNVKI